jgi:shikimate kinase
VTLEKPVALVGFYGARVRRTGYFLSSMTGLPYSDLDRQIEHAASRSLSQVHLEEGEQAWRALERDLIRRNMRERPCRVLCLGEGALLDPEVRQELLEHTTLIYVRRPRAVLLKNIHVGLREHPSRYPLMLHQFPLSTAALEPLLYRREPDYEKAHLMVDAHTLGPVETARLIASRLGWSVQ